MYVYCNISSLIKQLLLYLYVTIIFLDFNRPEKPPMNVGENERRGTDFGRLCILLPFFVAFTFTTFSTVVVGLWRDLIRLGSIIIGKTLLARKSYDRVHKCQQNSSNQQGNRSRINRSLNAKALSIFLFQDSVRNHLCEKAVKRSTIRIEHVLGYRSKLPVHDVGDARKSIGNKCMVRRQIFRPTAKRNNSRLTNSPQKGQSNRPRCIAMPAKFH